MKMIKKILALSLVAGSAFTLSACGKTVQRTATGANWDDRIVVNDLNDNSAWLTHKEVATYTLDFEKGNNTTYNLEYVLDGSKTAQYVTEFYAIKYDWNAAEIPQAYRTEKVENVYVYSTEANFFGKYTHKATGGVKEFDGSITTISLFRSAKNNLQPIYSAQLIKTASPANFIPAGIDDAYVEMDCEYETFYNFDCTEATVKTKDRLAPANDGEKTVKLKGDYSLFDVNSLGSVLRSLTLTGGSTTQFDLFIPAEGGYTSYKTLSAATGTLIGDDTEEHKGEKQIIEALENCTPDEYIFVGANAEGNKEYKFNAVMLSNASDMPGPSFTYWYANVADNGFNAGRAVMLRAYEPVYFDLGVITYSLSSLTYSEI